MLAFQLKTLNPEGLPEVGSVMIVVEDHGSPLWNRATATAMYHFETQEYDLTCCWRSSCVDEYSDQSHCRMTFYQDLETEGS